MGNLKLAAFGGENKDKSGKFIRYLPALVVGMLLAIISLLAFDVAASYMLGFLLSMPEETENSIKYLWVMLSDVSLALILSACAYYGYRTLLTKFPDDMYAAFLMQLPLVYVVLYLMPASFNFSSLYNSIPSVTAIVSSVSVLVVYCLSKLVRQRAKGST